ncbi:MAG: hypothetical protein OXC69_03210 [Candidatus Tectomicrobia bacterium]|nr:hypothetical protein [Candidatus Tectomicrobia bacterium]
MATLLGCGAALALLGGSLSSVRSQESDADRIPPRRVEGVVVTRDSLSVDVKEEDFSAVFRDIASQAQIDVSNLDGLPVRRISTQFVDLSIMDGVKRLLRVANVAGYVIMTAHSEGDVRIERILFLDANSNARAAPRAASPPRAARRRARRLGARSERARPTTANPREKSNGSTAVLEDLRASPETERLLNQAVDADEQGREQAIEGLMRLAGGSDRKRELMEALGPQLDDLRHGDEETREEARDVILSMMRR